MARAVAMGLAHCSLAECAAAYTFAFATAHAFHDGNKRTAFYVAIAFLAANDLELEEANAEACRDLILDAATRRIAEDDLTRWFEARIRPRQD